MNKRVRVLIAKPGLDGHDVGAKLVCRALMAAGMEVIYSGLRQSPLAVARTALQEDVDVIGLSILSGAHLPLVAKVRDAMQREGVADKLLIVGGNVPRSDHEALRQSGVAEVFPTGTPFSKIVSFLQREVSR